jgi:alkylresorcinol/alkylpyrone synthase
MPRVTSVGTAVPPHAIRQEDVQAFARNIFGEAFRDIDRLMPVFDHAEIEKRHFCVPLEWFGEAHGLQKKNDLYIENACALGREAILRCLEPVGLTPENIDHFYFISTTGMATPSIDARLIYQVGMNPHVKRTPIWGLGCAGGAVGLSRGYEYAKAFPSERVLILSVECCGLTFQRQQLTKSNLIATSLFADGAAAVLIEGSEVASSESGQSVTSPARPKAPRIVDTMSTIWKDSLDVMGWHITDDGLEVLFSRDIPTIVDSLMLPNMETFLSRNGLEPQHISHYITHPGGMKVISAYQQSLSLEEKALRHPKSVLRHYGNMSSASVLFVLNETMNDPTAEGEYGLVTALGPGFSSEMVLVQW